MSLLAPPVSVDTIDEWIRSFHGSNGDWGRIPTLPVAGIDPVLSDVAVTLAEAVVECSRLFLAFDLATQTPDVYRLLVSRIRPAVAAARAAFFRAEAAMVRAGVADAVNETLNDVLTINDNLRDLDPGNPGGHLAKLAALAASRTRFFRDNPIRRLRESLARAGTAPATYAPPGDGPHPNGPFEPFGFRYGGREVDFSGSSLRHTLLSALWDALSRKQHDSRSADEVLEAVYPKDDDADGKLKDLVRQTNKALARAAVPLKIKTAAGKYWLAASP